MNEDLNDLAVFSAVVETGTFTAAGKRLGMPKSTVSTRVSALEEQLNVRLLERTTRRLSLTEAGRLYFDACQRVLQEVANARQAVDSLVDAPRGKLRVSLPFAFARSLLAPLLPRFSQLYPELTLLLDVNNRRVDLLRDNLDVALRVRRLATDETVSMPIATFKQKLVASSSYVEMFGLPESPAELASHKVLAAADEFGNARLWRETGDESQVVEVKPKIGVGEPETRAMFVKQGLGIGWLPSFHCDEELAAGTLVECLADQPIPDAVVYAVMPTIRSNDLRVRVFVEFLRESLHNG